MDIVANLSKLGRVMEQVVADISNTPDPSLAPWVKRFKDAITQASLENPWFTADNITAAITHWATMLQPESLEKWLNSYHIAKGPPKRVALILAGNIPMVGFHDLLAVWVTGNIALVKYASKDQVLIPQIVAIMNAIAPEMEKRTEMVTGALTNYDAVIATGSNNTGRYFRYYFRDTPHIIRHNRTSIAVINGKEKPEQLRALGEDVFTYFGLGCRNVSKIFIPENYDLSQLLNQWEHFKWLTNHHKYANNYHYHKSVWLMNGEKFIDTGYVLLKEDKSLFAPLGTLYYEKYRDTDYLPGLLASNAADIQCIVSQADVPGAIPFGSSQSPALDDYADGIDTVDFLLKT